MKLEEIGDRFRDEICCSVVMGIKYMPDYFVYVMLGSHW